MDYLYALQSIRESSPALLNYFFLFISEVVLKGSIILMALIYWSFSKRDGLIISFGYVFSFSINQFIKNIVCMPRPWLLDSRLHVDPIAKSGATGFSFPSGHTVSAASIFGGTAVYQRKRKWLVVCCSVITLLTAFSRNWLGCHTLKDVVVALIIAAFTLSIMNILLIWFSKHQEKDFLICLIVCILNILILVFLQFKPYSVEDVYPLITDCYSSSGMVLGLMIGWLLERRFVHFSMEVPLKNKILRALIGSALIGLMYFGANLAFAFMGDHFSHLVKYFVIFFVVTFLYPLIFTKIEGKKNAD